MKKFKTKRQALVEYRKKNIKSSIQTGFKKYSSMKDAGSPLTYLLEPQKEIVIYWLLDNKTFEKKKKICGCTLTLGRSRNSRCCRPPGWGSEMKVGYCNFCRRKRDGAVTRYYTSEIIGSQEGDFSPWISVLEALEREPQGQLEILDSDIRLLDSIQLSLAASMRSLKVEPSGWSMEFHHLILAIMKEKRNLSKLRFTIDKINMLTNDDVDRWLMSVRSKLQREIGEDEAEKVFFSIAEASGIFDRTKFIGTALDPLEADDEREEAMIEAKYRKIAKAHPLSHGKHQYVKFEDIPNGKNGKNGKKNRSKDK